MFIFDLTHRKSPYICLLTGIIISPALWSCLTSLCPKMQNVKSSPAAEKQNVKATLTFTAYTLLQHHG